MKNMLNLFKLNLNEKNIKSKDNNNNKSLKHFPCSTREWNNSIYVYNKNTLKLIPVASDSSMKIIKSYFNIYNHRLEQKIRKERLLLRLRRLSSHKIYISKGEFKHTNDKVIVTLYLFNRHKFNLKLKIEKQYFKSVFKYLRDRLNKKFSIIKHKGFQSLIEVNKNKYLNETLRINKNFKAMYKYIINFYIKLIKQCLSKLKIYLLYKQLLFINRSKFNYIYLQFLKKYLEKIYNKNVEFNLVNLKRFFLNSDILSESITFRLTRNRRKILKYLNNLRKKVKTQKKNWLLQNVSNNNLNIKQNLVNRKLVKHKVFKNLKYKHTTGFRLETKGRLTRRYTASRSQSKFIYKGNIMNIDSSFRALSSVVLKGNLRSNVQYTKLKSKTRIGSFGIKGWVSSD